MQQPVQLSTCMLLEGNKDRKGFLRSRECNLLIFAFSVKLLIICRGRRLRAHCRGGKALIQVGELENNQLTILDKTLPEVQTTDNAQC